MVWIGQTDQVFFNSWNKPALIPRRVMRAILETEFDAEVVIKTIELVCSPCSPFCVLKIMLHLC